MITDAILGFFEAIVSFILDLAPDIAAPNISESAAGITPIWQYVGWANNFVPVDHLVVALGLVVTWWLVLHAVRFAVWVYEMLPFT